MIPEKRKEHKKNIAQKREFANMCKPMRDCPHCKGRGKLETYQELLKMRKARGKKFTALKVAYEMGIAPSYLCDLEHGRREWDAELIKRFKEALK
jgi:hypothetical protein